MFRIAALFLLLILAACTSTETVVVPTQDPISLVQDAANNIRSADTFRLDVTLTGPDYGINTGYGSVLFRRATAQYASPGTMQAAVRVSAAGLPVDVTVFSRGQDQWYRAIWTGGNWLHETFAPGFDPQTLIAEDTGFQAAMSAVIGLKLVGETTLENGANVYHINGTAEGSAVNALLVGLIETQGNVGVDLYVDRETGYPVRFVLTETVFDADGTAEREPRLWIIDVTDINIPVTLEAPPESTAEVTPEVTAESTHEATAEATPETTETP
ncbi:MAG: LppX_LprAFG lipoprotein [Anaerolineae bacterium]|nr:LppX_LprAFG lipoprotein [Anaerolineae bacterium]